MSLKRVVVTGLGALTPIGNDINSFWEGLVSGKSGADFITYFDSSKFKTQFACELKGYDPLNYFDRKEARKLDRFAQYAIVCSDEAIKDSGLQLEKIDKSRIGVIWGSGIGGFETIQNEMINYANGDGTPRFNPFFIPKLIPDIAPGVISIRHGFKGPNFAVVSACASANHAIGESFNRIKYGMNDIIVTGGTEGGITPLSIAGFANMKALTRNSDYNLASRPFDNERDGFVIAGGGGVLVLEEYEHAKARGAKIYAELTGYGATSDGYDMVAPSGEGAVRCMQMAMATAKNKVDYINTHGTSTPVGDITELNAVKEAFGNEIPKISSTKSLSGHPLGAASVHEAIYCLIMMKNNFITGSANISEMDEEAKKFPIVAKTETEATLNTVMSNSFGFGGTNATLVFEKV